MSSERCTDSKKRETQFIPFQGVWINTLSFPGVKYQNILNIEQYITDIFKYNLNGIVLESFLIENTWKLKILKKIFLSKKKRRYGVIFQKQG